MGIGNHITGFIKGSATELGAVMHNQNFTRLAANGIKNGNGNGTTVGILKESAGFIVAESTSMLVGFGAFAATANIAPSIVNGVSDALAKTVIEPFLDPIESGMQKICKLKECQPDPSVARDERARNVARTLLLFGASAAAAYGSKVLTRRVMNNHFGLHQEEGSLWNIFKQSRKEMIILASDESVHYGSLLLANTAAADTTDDFIRTIQNVLVRLGIPEKRAHELAGYSMVWELPNLLGLAAGLAAITATHKFPRHLGLPSH